MRQKVELVPDESIEQHACEVRLLLADASERRHHVSHASGTLENPLSDEALNDKFRSLVSNVLRPESVDELLESLWKLEEVRDVRDVVNLCRRREQSMRKET